MPQEQMYVHPCGHSRRLISSLDGPLFMQPLPFWRSPRRLSLGCTGKGAHSRASYLVGRLIEGTDLTPSILLELSLEQLIAGVDTRMQRAIELVIGYVAYCLSYVTSKPSVSLLGRRNMIRAAASPRTPSFASLNAVSRPRTSKPLCLVLRLRRNLID